MREGIHRRTFLKSVVWASGVAFLGAAYGFESSLLDVSRYELRVPGLARQLKIAALSDLHLPSLYVSPSELVEVVNREQVDVFLVVGDTIDEAGGEQQVSFLSQIRVSLAKLAILGNREYMRKLDVLRLRGECERAGMHLLVNETLDISGLRFFGFDDLIYGRPDYAMVERIEEVNTPALVVCHCPAVFDELKRITNRNIIMISGHTHGGQIAPLGHAFITPKGSGNYVRGWYGDEHQMMYVMRGIGTTFVPIRIGASPELLVLSLLGDNG